MKELLKYIKEEHDQLTCQIEEIELRIEFLKKRQQQLQHHETHDTIPEQISGQAASCESIGSAQTTISSEKLLLAKVDDVLARATVAMEKKDSTMPQLMPKLKNKNKIGKKVNHTAKPSKTFSNCSHKVGLKHQLPVEVSCSSSNDAALDDPVVKRRRRLQTKYSKLFRILESVTSSKNNFHHQLEYCLDSSVSDASLQDLPELSCIYKILSHILDSYIIPGNYNIENIRAIIRKTDEQFAAVTEKLCSYHNLSIAQSLLAFRFQSKSFVEKTAADNLKVVVFSKNQQISKFLSTYSKIVKARMHLKLVKELSQVSATSKLDTESLQLARFILSGRMFVPPVIVCN